MKRAVAILLACSCAAAPVREDEKANLAVRSVSVDNVQAAEADKAEACIPLAPCAKTTGVWLPPALAAETAGWGEGLVE